MTFGKRSDETTLNTKLDSVFRLAEPGSYSGSFELSDPETGGTLSVGSDGLISWTPGEDCAGGTYGVNATYFDGTNLQMKALSLTIEAVDLPPVFPDWSGYGGFAETKIVAATIAVDVDYTFAAGDVEGAVAYSLAGSYPPGAWIDSTTGEFHWTPTMSYLDEVYAFDVVATDSASQTDVVHVAMPVNKDSEPDKLIADQNEWHNVDIGSSSNLFYVYPQWPVGSYLPVDAVLHFSQPVNGAVTQSQDPMTPGQVYYTPSQGFHGVDTFEYWWTYTLRDYDGVSKGSASTNHAQVGVLVGPSVDLAPTAPYTTDTALVGVGGSTTLKLTLENPRADGYPAVGYWQLGFTPGVVRVYQSNGREVVPSSTLLDVVPGADQITLTVVGVTAGQANISASWYVWDASDPYGAVVPGWHLCGTDPATVDVMGLEWVNNNNKAIPGDTDNHHIQIADGQRLILKVVGVPNPTTCSYWWVVGDHAVQNYNPAAATNQVTPLTNVSTDTVNYAYYAPGTRTVQVDVSGTIVKATFDVLRPDATFSATVDPNGIAVGDTGFPFAGADLALHFGTATAPGITFGGTVTPQKDGQVEVIQLITPTGVAYDHQIHKYHVRLTTSPPPDGYTIGDPVLDPAVGFEVIVGVTAGVPATLVSLVPPHNPDYTDAPYTPLDSVSFRAVSRKDVFDTYLMYKPNSPADDSIWVTLREQKDWSWGGRATWDPRDEANGGWSLNGKSGPSKGTTVDTTDLPQWKASFKDFLFLPD